MADVMTGEWLTTGANPQRHRAFSNDDGITGWKVHFVREGSTVAVCGLRAKHGWATDIVIDARCARCTKALEGVETKEPAPEPYSYFSIHHSDTHKLFWEGRDKAEAVAEAAFATPHSEHYITEWFGSGQDSDEIIEQVSVDEWLDWQPPADD